MLQAKGKLAQGFAATDNVGCVTGLTLPLEIETAAQMWFEQYAGFSKGFERRIFDMGEHRPKSSLYPYHAGMFGSGNNMAFRAAALSIRLPRLVLLLMTKGVLEPSAC